MRAPIRATPADGFSLAEFLREVETPAAGLESPDLRIWMDLDPDGRIVATTGYELAGTDALLRAIAVAPAFRGSGRGTELVRFALERAAAEGATRAWLVSRHSADFWSGLGFEPTDIGELAKALAATAQVRAFSDTGQLRYETGWVRSLP